MFPKKLDIFSFSSWCPDFELLTLESAVIDLPAEFLDYLAEDGIRMPPGLEALSIGVVNEDFDDDTPATEWGLSDEEENEEAFRWLPSLMEKVNEKITNLGGSVFPKLNWSAPKDACWILPNRQLKCTSLADILLLLKASTFIAYDVARLRNATDPDSSIAPEMVLRQWSEINPSWEFRCFVRDNTLVGISQRYCSACYAHIPENRAAITATIKSFFARKIRAKFPVSDFVFDIVTYGPEMSDVRLLDFNAFSQVTDGILFSWNELTSAEDIPDEELLRFIMTPLSIQPDEMRQYEIPSDFSDRRFSTNGRGLFDYLDSEIGSQHRDDNLNSDGNGHV